MMLIPATLGSAVLRDRLRFVQCENGQRQDCRSSAIWAMYDWNLADTSSTSPMVIDQRATKSSPTAPDILQGQVVDAQAANGIYSVEPGAQAQVSAQVDGAKTVTLYLVTTSPSSTKRLTTLTLQKDNKYSGSFLAAPGLRGKLEIRALNAKGEATSLFLDVTTQHVE